ncbi:LAETG motif-containing sortase-dependent surface protein [Streptomyces sp. NPDC048629]|uniref:LAETG motif-containing sortase-dependent surface protein n=1 Tax=Streptomyces sp. NPDC048629 TaxID=3154824 RepID=UPI00342C3FAD
MLATAVAAAVTTPVVLLSAAPAFADTKPAAQTGQQDQKPTIEELERRVAAAQKTYDAAVVTLAQATADREAALKDDSPLAKAAIEAKTAADTANAKWKAAEAKQADAEAALAALPDTATAEEKAAAEKAVADAKTVATGLAGEAAAADTAYNTAVKERDDQRVAAVRAEGLAKTAKEDAFKALKAAEKELADAKAEEGEGGEEGEDCVPEPKFTTVVTGLPSKVVGGATVNFTLKVTNGTEKKLDEVYPYAFVSAFDTKGLKELDKFLDLEYYADGTWKDADDESEDADEFGIGNVGPLKAKSSVDVKLRLKVDAKIPAGQGAAFVAGDYWNEDESCGGTPDLDYYEFEILAKGSNPGKVDDAKGKPGKSNTPGTQGGANNPVTNGSTNGSLAKTGSSDVVPQIAMAGAAAVALGAGAVFLVRRRKAGSDA